jgi:uncharacterized protein (TIGR02145 family)
MLKIFIALLLVLSSCAELPEENPVWDNSRDLTGENWSDCRTDPADPEVEFLYWESFDRENNKGKAWVSIESRSGCEQVVDESGDILDLNEGISVSGTIGGNEIEYNSSGGVEKQLIEFSGAGDNAWSVTVCDQFDSCITETGELDVPPSGLEDGGNVFIDSRDGKVYPYVTIGSQVWMAKNLAWLPEGVQVVDWQHYDRYGWPYSFEAAIGEGSVDENGYIQGACPQGWHLPSNAEWQSLGLFIAWDNDVSSITEDKRTIQNIAQYLKVDSIWVDDDDATKGEDRYGFGALPAFEGLDGATLAYWWSVTETKDSVFTLMLYDTDDFHINGVKRGSSLNYSIRCIRDVPAEINDNEIFNDNEAFRDDRDGTIYRKVTIGEQTWMAENLAWLPSINYKRDVSAEEPVYKVMNFQLDTTAELETELELAKKTVEYDFEKKGKDLTITFGKGKKGKWEHYPCRNSAGMPMASLDPRGLLIFDKHATKAYNISENPYLKIKFDKAKKQLIFGFSKDSKVKIQARMVDKHCNVSLMGTLSSFGLKRPAKTIRIKCEKKGKSLALTLPKELL